jgi:hypothetical protein
MESVVAVESLLKFDGRDRPILVGCRRTVTVDIIANAGDAWSDHDFSRQLRRFACGGSIAARTLRQARLPLLRHFARLPCRECPSKS